MKKMSKLTTGLVGQPMLKILTAVNAMEAEGRPVYHFEVGDSDFDAFPHIIEATKQALDNHHTRYVGSMGIIPLREEICRHTEQALGFRPSINQVVIMPSNSIIDFVVRCTVDPGEEVIFPDPGFPSYYAVTNYLGVKAVRVPLREEKGFRLDPQDLINYVTDKTRLIIVNSPQNPTGAVLTGEEIRQIAAIAREKDVYLLSDEIYSDLIYDNAVHYSPGCEDQCRERTIILHGFSKGHSMSGWRLGYAIGPEELIKKMALMFETIYSCVPPFIQQAGISALQSDKTQFAQRVKRYNRLRDLVVSRLNEIPGVQCRTPQGSIYAFPNITGTGMSSDQFAQFVLEKAGVALVPGCCFGPSGEGYVRLCYLREERIIEEACAKMKAAFAAGGKEN